MFCLHTPYMDTIIGLMSPAAPGVFESLITFTAFELLHIRMNPQLMLLTSSLRLERFMANVALKPWRVTQLFLVFLQQRFSRENLPAFETVFTSPLAGI